MIGLSFNDRQTDKLDTMPTHVTLTSQSELLPWYKVRSLTSMSISNWVELR